MPNDDKEVLAPDGMQLAFKVKGRTATICPTDNGSTTVSLTFRKLILGLDTGLPTAPAVGSERLFFGEDRRADPCGDLSLPAELVTPSGRNSVNVRHISSGGAVIEGAIETKAGELATLIVDAIGPVPGLITWEANRRFGFLFATHIDMAGLHAAEQAPDFSRDLIVKAPEIRAQESKSELPRFRTLGDASNTLPAQLTSSAAGRSHLQDGPRINPVMNSFLPSVAASRLSTTSPSPWRNRMMVGAVVLATTALAATLLSGALDRTLPNAEPLPESVGKFAGGVIAPRSGSHSASPIQDVKRERKAASATPARQDTRMKEIARPRRPSARIRPELTLLAETTSPSSAELEASSGSAIDPYAGRVAKPLSGTNLQSALAADSRATKELNLRQLRQVQAASATSQDEESDAGRVVGQ